MFTIGDRVTHAGDDSKHGEVISYDGPDGYLVWWDSWPTTVERAFNLRPE